MENFNIVAAIGHITILSGIIIYLVTVVIRKHRLSRYQWIWLMQIAVLNIVEIIYMITYDTVIKGGSCGHQYKMYNGTIYWLFYTTTISVAFKYQ